MADDIVTHLANLATDHGCYRTHYEGCHLYHLECAALIVSDEIERLRDELIRTRAERDHAQVQADHLAQRLVKEARRER